MKLLLVTLSLASVALAQVKVRLNIRQYLIKLSCYNLLTFNNSLPLSESKNLATEFQPDL